MHEGPHGGAESGVGVPRIPVRSIPAMRDEPKAVAMRMIHVLLCQAVNIGPMSYLLYPFMGVTNTFLGHAAEASFSIGCGEGFQLFP
jgi:hypothetical protein